MFPTLQSYYDWLIQSATNGTFPSVEEDQIAGKINCRYRENLQEDCPQRCAIGGFIPDEKYDPKWDIESLTVQQLFKIHPEFFPDFISAYDLKCVQNIHDLLARTVWNPQEFINRINNLAVFQTIEKRNPQ